MKEKPPHKSNQRDAFHARTVEEVAEFYSTNVATGLTDTEAEHRAKKYGLNVLQESSRINPLLILLRQLKGPFIILLFIAAALSFWFKEWLDATAILIVVLINTLIGFGMEYKAGRTMEALKRLTKINARVIRNGSVNEISSEKIVPGDVLFVEAGDIITCDARIVESVQAEVDESALTGESIPVAKTTEPLEAGTQLGDRINMLYKGTFMTKGNARAVVTGTGMQTELGQIAEMVQEAEHVKTPLEKKITRFSVKMLWLTLVLIIVIFFAGMLRGHDIYAFLQTSIALAVAAIPEGLPIVATLTLAHGMIQMARRHVLIKKLVAVETLGCTTIICADKTGTLTENKIEVASVAIPDGIADIQPDVAQRKLKFVRGEEAVMNAENLGYLTRISVLCNTAQVEFSGKRIRESGDPLETALLKFVYCRGESIPELKKAFPKIAEEPFSSETKFMATLHESENGFFVAAKGAVEELLERCMHQLQFGNLVKLDENTRKQWYELADQLAASGLRVIALAHREDRSQPKDISKDLVFTGLIGMYDPPRGDVHKALNECRTAGIEVTMVTGDHPATAAHIGKQLGITSGAEEEIIHGKSMTTLGKASDEERQRWIHARIFARVTPRQKLDLVTVLQENNYVVGMTGDGVNDAPALKKADIGIAMGQRGTQVAQEAADIILQDDSFASIVAAIRHGRIIYENIRKFLMFLLSCNISELIIIAYTSILDLPYALVPLQILYINLITDVFPALALGFTEGSKQIMKIPPQRADDAIIDKKRWVSIIIYSAIIAAASLGAVGWACNDSGSGESDSGNCNSILVMTLIFAQLLNAFNMTLDNNIAFFRTDVFRNKFVWFAIALCILLMTAVFLVGPISSALSLSAPGIREVAVALGCSLLSMIIIRTMKRVKIIL